MQKKIEVNLKLVEDRIHNAAKKADIAPDHVLLIAVSKKKDIEAIKIAFNSGIKDFGENYAQELAIKSELLINEKVTWHFIGPVQTNKIKLIAKHSSWIHSLDRPKVIERLNKECLKAERSINGLIQINTSGEETKSGISPDKLLEFAKYVDSQTNILLKGIMVLPSLGENNKKQMQDSKLLHEKLISVFPHAEYLSMGTTNDFESAIVSGSNMIRVGELIFGKR